MFNKKNLSKFLVEAKKVTYAAGDKAQIITEADKSKSIYYEKGDYKYHDNFFGGEPFGGREVVFCQDQPIYIMTYYGKVLDSLADFKEIYKVLQHALSQIPLDYPYRGPKEFIENNLIYKNDYQGEINDFYGQETISTLDGKILFHTSYSGGFICQR